MVCVCESRDGVETGKGKGKGKKEREREGEGKKNLEVLKNSTRKKKKIGRLAIVIGGEGRRARKSKRRMIVGWYLRMMHNTHMWCHVIYIVSNHCNWILEPLWKISLCQLKGATSSCFVKSTPLAWMRWFMKIAPTPWFELMYTCGHKTPKRKPPEKKILFRCSLIWIN